MGALFGCVCVLFGAFIGLLILSVIIRAAVWIANKCVGGSGGGRSYYEEDDWDDYDRPRRRRRGNNLIPEPELFKGMGIGLVVCIAQFAVSFVIALALVGGMGAMGGGGGGNPFGGRGGGGADPVMQLLANGISFVTGFLIWSGILTAMLPTSFPRAALVTVFIYLILIAIGIIIVVGVAVLGVGMGGFR